MSVQSLLNSFRGVSSTPAAAPAPTAPAAAPNPNPNPMAGGNPNPVGTHTDTSTAANGTVPAGSSETPFAGMEKLWENASPADGKTTPKQKGVFGDVNPEAFAEAARSIDFTQIVTPEIKSRMAAGGEDGIKASMEAMNLMNQANYANSAQVSTKLIEKALETFTKQLQSNLPGLIKKHNTSNSLRNDNPVFANPAAAPVLDMLQRGLHNQFPKASEQEITTMAKKFITDLASPFAPKPEEEVNTDASGGDWEDYFKQ